MVGWLKRLFGCGCQARTPGSNAAQVRPGQEQFARLASSDPAVRESAAKALRELGPAALPALHEGLKQADPRVGQASAELLGELRQPESVGPLLVALKYAARPVQLAARPALERLGTLAVPVLQEARSEPQVWVRQQIEEILAQVKPEPILEKRPGAESVCQR